MIKEIKKITNSNIDLSNLEENHLSIQLSLDGFSFCIYNKAEKVICAFASYEFPEGPINPIIQLELIRKIFFKEELLQHKYKSVSASHLNNLVAQVPVPFFNKKNLADYLQYSVKLLENDYITFDEINNADLVNVYIPFVNINNFLIDTYGSFIFKHSSTILIETLLNNYKNLDGDFCFVNVSKFSFDLLVIKNKKLELFNSFTFKTKEDFIYYILFTAEQLNLNPEEFKLILLGDIEKESELYTILYQYVRNIEFYNFKSLNKIIDGIPSHAHFTLLNQF